MVFFICLNLIFSCLLIFHSKLAIYLLQVLFWSCIQKTPLTLLLSLNSFNQTFFANNQKNFHRKIYEHNNLWNSQKKSDFQKMQWTLSQEIFRGKFSLKKWKNQSWKKNVVFPVHGSFSPKIAGFIPDSKFFREKKIRNFFNFFFRISLYC